MDPALAGIVVPEGFENEILHMHMESVRRGDGNGPEGIIVGAEEIAHIHQPAVIGVVHGADQVLHPLGVLQDEAMVFRAGADALFRGVFSHFPDQGSHLFNALPPGHALGQAPERVVAHHGRAQDLRDVRLGLDVTHRVFVVQEVRAHRVGRDGKAQLFAVLPDAFCQGRQAVRRLHVQLQVDKLDGVKAYLLCQIAYLKIIGVGLPHVVGKAVGGNADFHIGYPFLSGFFFLFWMPGFFLPV